MSSRAPRPSYQEVDKEQLLEAWKPLLELREPGFKWTGDDYNRSGRNQSVDKPGLLRYEKALVPLLMAAPSGFPTQSSLRDVFIVADSRHSILVQDARGRHFHANNAADIFRKMCKDVYNLCKGEAPSEMQDLMKLISPKPPKTQNKKSLPSRPSASPTSTRSDGPAPLPMPKFATFSDLSGDDDDDDVVEDASDSDSVELVRISCQCPMCAGDGGLKIPGAGIGEQKKSCQAASDEKITPPKKRRRHSFKKPEDDKVEPCESTGAEEAATTDDIGKAVTRINPMLNEPIVLPIEVIKRSSGKKGKKGKECYILQNSKKFQYVVCVTQKHSKDYESIINTIAKLINSKEIKTPADARKKAIEMREAS